MEKLDYNKIKAIVEERKIAEPELYKFLGISRQNWGNFKKTGLPLKYGRDAAHFLGVDMKLLLPNDAIVNKNFDKVTVKAYKSSIDHEGLSSSITELNDIDFEAMDINLAILPKKVKYSNLKAIQVSGKSMLPTFLPEDWVVFEENKNSFDGDDLYVVNYLNNLLVKRIAFNPAIGKVDIISDNLAFPKYSIDIDDTEAKGFAIVGKVIATVQQ